MRDVDSTTVEAAALRPDKCPRCHLRPTWVGSPEPLCWECSGGESLAPDACGWCGYRHNPRFTSCTEVRGRVDGVSVSNPEGGAVWAQPTPARVAAGYSETDEEWAW